ncbi:MAG: hypothetical protein A3G32_01170 [Deltaproteobacteria bacterium RIFCSPLOWO2_12_FULL_40_28]|nr:MAG: hypothetical protein A3C45_10055 [Deltaproteobacteria bacterium RIFCSPHIGHO2_02_FULL_40_28]OGQ19942.1 MAG: hypothetical protein A3E27_07005 [Deltaproteobacteria bacterium RIFCSPHIGHO2_12_FULL_40_32]OGQ39701.1 MAG: hypothetical protein A3I69_06435 [Deltaproteobacteria bacterium RIFCSPLOWO2_02_FULL_40_36]OGQ52956.1 MAG: hypothetical protein A3G32_01170 [Deltaproteobacteria bacterium RIFCSPLOWO2_12_FULL_40_28]
MKNYLIYWQRMVACSLKGSVWYRLWLLFLTAFVLWGAFNYYHHLKYGLITTNMSDAVSWGIGIANFVFFVGIAATAVILVFPAYIFKREDLKSVVIIGELLAFIAIMMCLLFIFTDIGHPERFWHLLPVIGRLNIPNSLLAWDVIVFNVYLVLNLHIPGYLLYQKYRGKPAKKIFYLPLTWISIFFAISIHTVTAFLLVGLGARYFWNTSILAPRFLISAFASGPALLIIIFLVLSHFTTLKIQSSIIDYLRKVMMVTLPVNLFLFLCEFFKEIYPNTLHAASAQYLFFGLDGHNMLTKWIWSAVFMNCVATVLILIPKWSKQNKILIACCVLTIVGIWIEKGMGLIFPGFIPTPLGEIVEYSPNLGEIAVSLGVTALGALIFTLMTKAAVWVLTDKLAHNVPPQ